jgi:putative ABC transport system ATP-binding protein
MSLLSFEHVGKSYRDGRGSVKALDDVSLEIYAGDFVGIWGSRRSGKTTLLRIAAGVEPADCGRVTFDGRDVGAMSADTRAKLQRRGGISLVGGDWWPGRNKPMIEHVALALLSDGMSLREARAPAYRALEQVGMESCAHLPADRLSRLERARVGLARAVARRPRLLLIDEPEVLLSPRAGVVELWDLLGPLVSDPGGFAIVVAAEEIASLRRAGRMMSLDMGRLRCDDREGTVLQFPTRRSAEESQLSS